VQHGCEPATPRKNASVLWSGDVAVSADEKNCPLVMAGANGFNTLPIVTICGTPSASAPTNENPTIRDVTNERPEIVRHAEQASRGVLSVVRCSIDTRAHADEAIGLAAVERPDARRFEIAREDERGADWLRDDEREHGESGNGEHRSTLTIECFLNMYDLVQKR
jgi:hypothetical protein